MSKKQYTYEQYQKAVRLKTKRISVIIATFLVGLLLFSLLRVTILQAFHRYHGIDLVEESNNMYQNERTLISKRGIITDAQGNELAINVNTYDLRASLNENNKTITGEPDYVQDKERTVNELLNILGLSDNQQARDLFTSQLNSGADEVMFGSYGKNLNLDQKNAIDELNLPGIGFYEIPSRYYPYGDFASYAVGYAKYDENNNLIGEMGIEQQMDGYLRGENGKVVNMLDANGIPIAGVSEKVITPKVDGNNIELTIDANIQAIVQEEMTNALADKQFDLAYTLITDVKTGEILAMHSLPTFDPNVRNVENYTNPFTSYCFEPGSTIKTFLVAEAMERGVWDANKTVKTGNTTRPSWGGVYIGDWVWNKHKASWGMLEWNKGFYVSSNTVMLAILDEVGYDTWVDALSNKWEFGKAVDSSLFSTDACTLNPQADLDIATTAFGQGMTSNAMQMARAYSAIGNNGVMTTPHIVKEITTADTGEVIYTDTQDSTLQTKQVVSEQTANQVLKEMESVVTYKENMSYRIGTGYLADGGAIPLAIKTGTAEVAGDNGYSKSAGEISSYATIAPANDPQIFMYTVLVNPTSTYLDFLGKMVKNIANKSVNYLTQKSNGITINDDTNRIYFPDYTGREISEVVAELQQQGINVSALGDGKVIKQYPGVNQVISKNQQVILRGENLQIDFNVLKGMTNGQAQGVCNVMDWDCHFNGPGSIVDIVPTSDYSVNLECKLPDQVNEELNQRKRPEENQTS